MKKIIAMFIALAGMIPVAAQAQFAGNGTFAQPSTPGGTATVQTNGAGTVTSGNATVFMPDSNGVYNNGVAQVRPDGRLMQAEQTVNVNTSGCQRNLGNALACMGVQAISQILVNRSAVREQVAGQQRLARTFTTGQPAASRQPIGQCQRLDGNGTTVWQGEDPNQVCN